MTIPQSHRRGPWYGHWRPTSKKWQKKNRSVRPWYGEWREKNPVCETKVWSLAARVKNLNAGVRRLSKLSITDGGRTPVLKLLPSRLPQIRWHGIERGEFTFLMSDTDVKKKKAEFGPFHSAPSYLRWSGRQQFQGRLPWSINKGRFWWTTDAGVQVFDPVHQWPGHKPERWCPLSIKTSPYWWTKDAGLKILAFRSAANTIVRNRRGRIQLFFSWHRCQTFRSAP